MTLVELLEQEFRVERLVSAGYELSIRNVIRTYERYRGITATVEDLSDANLRGMAAWLVGHNVSRATINKNLRTLIALANFARRNGHTTYRPDVAKLPEHRQRPIAWRYEEFGKLVTAIHKVFGDSSWGKLLYAVVMVQYDTALRVIDSLAIESNVDDFHKGIVYVTEQKTQKRRGFKLHPDTVRAVEAAELAVVVVGQR